MAWGHLRLSVGCVYGLFSQTSRVDLLEIFMRFSFPLYSFEQIFPFLLQRIFTLIPQQLSLQWYQCTVVFTSNICFFGVRVESIQTQLDSMYSTNLIDSFVIGTNIQRQQNSHTKNVVGKDCAERAQVSADLRHHVIRGRSRYVLICDQNDIICGL